MTDREQDLLAILERFASFYYAQGALTDASLRLQARIVDDLYRVLGAERMTEIQSACSVGGGGGMCENEER